jgi:hypothetical protein
MNRLKELEETPSACILYAASSVPIAELTGSNIFIFPEPDFSFLHKDAAIEKRPMYITAAGEKRNGEVVKQGFIAICPMSKEQTRPLADTVSQGRSSEYAVLKKEISDEIIGSIRRSYPGIAEKITDTTCPHRLHSGTIPIVPSEACMA